MIKEKFSVPLPDEETIHSEINKIVIAGIKPKQSLLSCFMDLYKVIGWKYLFTNQRDGLFITFSVMTVLIYLFSNLTETAQTSADVYPFLFAASPLLYISLSFYDFLYKRHYATFEMEMVSKYNLYQITGFKMLIFSMLSIFVNTMAITFLAIKYEAIHLLTAFFVSTTALFLFSIIFLAALIKKQTGWRAAVVILGWIGSNIVLTLLPNHLYSNILLKLPIFVYSVVLLVSIFLYLQYLNRLMRMKPAEGV